MMTKCAIWMSLSVLIKYLGDQLYRIAKDSNGFVANGAFVQILYKAFRRLVAYDAFVQ